MSYLCTGGHHPMRYRRRIRLPSRPWGETQTPSREAPPHWREDLAAALGTPGAAGADWLGDLNSTRPWCTLVGDVQLRDGRRLVMKYHQDAGEWAHERAAARFLMVPGAPPVGPRFAGGDERSLVLVFERLSGTELGDALDASEDSTAMATLLAAARTLGELHRWSRALKHRWLHEVPGGAATELLPGYDRSDEELAAPFRRVVNVTESFLGTLAMIRRTMTAPGRWLGFCHGDLQVRHVVVTAAGVRFIDWERAGLRHQVYDLACLLTKPQAVGGRLPIAAQAAAATAYCHAAGLRVDELSADLACIVAFESLIGVAENHETEPALAAGQLAELMTQAYGPLQPLHAPAAALRAELGHDRLRVYRGLAFAERGVGPPDGLWSMR